MTDREWKDMKKVMAVKKMQSMMKKWAKMKRTKNNEAVGDAATEDRRS